MEQALKIFEQQNPLLEKFAEEQKRVIRNFLIDIDMMVKEKKIILTTEEAANCKSMWDELKD